MDPSVNPSVRFNRLIWVGLVLASVLLLLGLFLARLETRNAFAKPLPVYGQVAAFTLTNQDGQPFSFSDLKGKVWVADIIFTRCPGPCLKMSRQMRDLQAALPPTSQAALITLTTDPQFDTPLVLKAYAQRFGADSQRWTFLTGTQEQVARLAIDSLKLTAIQKKPEDRQSPADLFIHSTIFVVVDKQGQLRGIFETTGETVDPVQVKQEILSTVKRLEHEA